MTLEQNTESVDSGTINPEPQVTDTQSSEPITSTRDAIEASVKELAAKAESPTETPEIKGKQAKPSKQKSGEATPKAKTTILPGTAASTASPDYNQEDLSNRAIEAKEPEDNKPAIPTPKFFDAEKRAKFEKLPYEAKEIVAAFEHQTRSWGSQIAQEVAEVRKVQQALESVIAPHENLLKLNRTDPIQAVDHLLTNAALMEQNPIMMISRFMQQYGLTPEHFMNGGYSYQNGQGQYQPQYNEEYSDPRADEALNRVNSIEERLQREAEERESQKQQALLSEIDSFRSETDANGQPLRPHFDFFRRQIGDEVDRLEAEKPWLSPQQLLNEAYTKITSHLEETFVKPRLSNGQFAPNDSRVVQQSRRAEAAAGSLSGSSLGNSTQRKITSTADAMREARRELGML